MAMMHHSFDLPKTSFALVPEGVHIFKIDSINYKELYGKLEINLVTKEGYTHTERFSLMDNSGRPNQKALNAFGYFAKVALNNFDATNIDLDDLLGHYIECTVTHEQVPKKNGKAGEMSTFSRLGDKAPAAGFEGEAPVEEDTPAEKPQYDLESVLG